mmetsp:Transcript_44739/g.117319  ORF Transcript_44739/g.117319 Transcript_44739/m.117319 type:complete len:235 (+) Transcript_44739:915-1619(+)
MPRRAARRQGQGRLPRRRRAPRRGQSLPRSRCSSSRMSASRCPRSSSARQTLASSRRVSPSASCRRRRPACLISARHSIQTSSSRADRPNSPTLRSGCSASYARSCPPRSRSGSLPPPTRYSQRGVAAASLPRATPTSRRRSRGPSITSMGTHSAAAAFSHSNAESGGCARSAKGGKGATPCQRSNARRSSRRHHCATGRGSAYREKLRIVAETHACSRFSCARAYVVMPRGGF